MSKKINIKIPTSLDEITVGQYLEYRSFYDNIGEKDPNSLKIKTVSLFCDVSLAVAHAMRWSDIEEINEKILDLFDNHNHNFTPITKING